MSSGIEPSGLTASTGTTLLQAVNQMLLEVHEPVEVRVDGQLLLRVEVPPPALDLRVGVRELARCSRPSTRCSSPSAARRS
jgi:hypothetical protein